MRFLIFDLTAHPPPPFRLGPRHRRVNFARGFRRRPFDRLRAMADKMAHQMADKTAGRRQRAQHEAQTTERTQREKGRRTGVKPERQ